MRQSIILPNKYERIFLNEAEKSDLISPVYNSADEIYPSKELNEAKEIERNMLDSKINERQNIFRILLLFDDIIIPSVTMDYNYDKLKKTGLFSLFFRGFLRFKFFL